MPCYSKQSAYAAHPSPITWIPTASAANFSFVIAFTNARVKGAFAAEQKYAVPS